MRFELALTEFWGFMFVLVRTAAILMTLPLIGTRIVPMRVRAALAFAIALVFAPMVAVDFEPDWLVPLKLAIGLGTELLIGVVLGFATRLLFAAVEIAGTVMGYQVGFGVAVQLDPVNQVETPVIGTFLVVLASLLYFAVDGHHLILMALGSSFVLIPPFSGHLHPSLLTDGTQLMQNTFLLGLKLATPLMVSTVLVYLVLGILGRVIPQMNVLFLGFPLTISIGLLVLGFGLPLFALLFQQSILGLEGVLMDLLQEMGRG